VATVLILEFPLGRYHATPWLSQVNEGHIELPPSPWRLLRMLYSVWQTRCPGLGSNEMHTVLARLAVPPTFYVPNHTVAHTRHYYPDAHTGTDRTLDAFAVFAPGARLAARWPFDLPAPEHATLAELAHSIPYLGRADSICTGTVGADFSPTDHKVWSPLDVADSSAGYREVASVLSPALPLDVSSLLPRPAEVRRKGLTIPAKSRLVAYCVTDDSTRSVGRPKPAAAPAEAVTAVRFDVLQAAYPPDTSAVAYADLLRRAALRKRFDGVRPAVATDSMLGGKAADGSPLRDRDHAHYLPLVKGREITGLLVWSAGGLSQDDVDALNSIRKLYEPRDRWRLTLRASGAGSISDICPELTGKCADWTSVTPFAPSRHPGRKEWGPFVKAEVRRELTVRGVGAELIGIEFDPKPWTEFVRYRPTVPRSAKSGQGRAGVPSIFLRLRFAEPVAGPLALGRLSHFGLGLFGPEPGQALPKSRLTM
jgi:CRISPR-associated protein Csb2